MRKSLETLRISDPGVAVLVDREGLRTEAYQDTEGVWTIGIGHTSAAGPPKVTPHAKVTEEEAWDIFWRDTETFRREARGLVKVPLEQHELDALASFIFNVGVPQFKGSTVRKKLNAGDYQGAGEALLMWMKPPEVASRRRGEHAQFLRGEYVARLA